MTVTANTTRNDYTAGSAQSVYNYTFQLNEAADVDVYLDGVKQTLNTHYTVQNIGNASGGTITFTLVDANNNPIHPTQGAIINIVMAMDLDRDTNYQPSGAFLAADVNNDFDRLWLATNQQQTAVNRALRLQDTDVTTSSMELPLKDDRKGKLLGFNASTGDPEATTNNQSNWDTAYNDTITSASFSGSTLTLGQQDGGTITASHTPYLPIAGGTLTGDLAFGANKAVFPSLEIYGVIGDHSVIRETGSGNLFIHGTDVRIQSAENEDVIKGVANGAVTLYYDNNPKLATTNTGISVTGTLSATGYNDANWNTAYNDKINAVNFSSSNNTLTLTQQDGSTLTTIINGSLTGGGETLAQTLAIGNTTSGNDISFGDNDKATFGASDDLQIYHNGTHSYIDEVGTGSLYIRANDFRLSNADGSQNHIIANNNGEVSLRYAGSPKLATTASGIDVTGAINGDSFNVNNSGSGNGLIKINGATGSTEALIFQRGGTEASRIGHSNSADLSFYTGSGVSERMRIDTSGNVGIGSSSPDHKLHIEATNDSAFRLTRTGVRSFRQYIDSSGKFVIRDLSATPADRLTIDTSGNVGIGESSPLQKLHVNGNALFENNKEIRFKDSGATQRTAVALDSSNDLNIGTSAGGNLKFINGSSYAERMRIDSSGSVLVGKTSSGFNTAGVEFASSGRSRFTRDSANVIEVNRTTNDGSLVTFNKDGTAVGSIGTASGDLYIGTGDTGLSFGDGSDAIVPVSSTSSRDAAINLGIASNRFKDLYLSNKVTNPSGALSVETSGGNQLLLKGSSELVFHTNNTERARFNSSGNLGIGTTSPSDKLEVASSSSVNIKLNNTGNGTSLLLGAQATAARLTAGSGDKLGLGANDTADGLVLDTSNNVGIGTSSPSADLHIYRGGSGVTPATDTGLFIEGQSSCTLQLAAYWAGVTNINFGVGPYSSAQDYDNGQIYYSNYSKAMAFKANGSERVRINSYGQLLVGTTGSQDTASKIVTTGRVRASTFLASTSNSQFYDSGNYGYAGITLYSYLTNSATTQKMMSFKASNGTEYGAITISGTTVTYGTGSDERLKENIRDAEDAGDKIDAIKIRQFDWKESGQHQDYGVIAQELDEVAPEAVAKGYTEDDMMSVDYSKLVPTLIKEIQSLRNRVAELEKN